MSKVSMSSHPEPGYENMDRFSVNVDHVAEMLRTIEFQTGQIGDNDGVRQDLANCWESPGLGPQAGFSGTGVRLSRSSLDLPEINISY